VASFWKAFGSANPISIWTPAPVYARSAQTATTSLVEKAKITVVKLNINNKTSGYLYINLVGEGRNYYLAATSKDKNFQIQVSFLRLLGLPQVKHNQG
jgi:hypothetical protein